MKKIIRLSEYDIISLVAEKFKVDRNDVEIRVFLDGDRFDPKKETVIIEVESEVQNYDL